MISISGPVTGKSTPSLRRDRRPAVEGTWPLLCMLCYASLIMSTFVMLCIVYLLCFACTFLTLCHYIVIYLSFIIIILVIYHYYIYIYTHTTVIYIYIQKQICVYIYIYIYTHMHICFIIYYFCYSLRPPERHAEHPIR